MHKGKKRQPKEGATPSGIKQPRAVEPPSYMDRKAAWRLRRVQMADPYGWHQLKHEQLIYVQEKLSAFESMTWNEIFVDSKKQNHDIAVSELRCGHARRWMRRNMPDQPTLWTLRFSGAERVWGIFSEGIYQILFWDPEHLIYPTNR
jgi:hypothetical protein